MTSHIYLVWVTDHICLHFNLICCADHWATVGEKCNLYLADFCKMRNILEMNDWNALDHLDMYKAWDYFYDVFNKSIKECIPLSKSKTIEIST